MQVTGIAQQESWNGTDLPPVEQVRPGLWSIPVPIPNNPLRYVLTYAFETGSRAVLIDPGWNADTSFAALEAGLSRASLAVADVRGVIVTHIHPDHYGLAGRVREKSGAWVGLHPADAAQIGQRVASQERLAEMVLGDILDAGATAADAERLLPTVREFRRAFEFATPDRLVEDGDRIEAPGWDIRAVWTPGHSPGHLCFYDAERSLLFSGDHVLPHITPNVAAHRHNGPDPLGAYLASLRRLLEMDEPAEVLPAHKWRFVGLRERIEEILAHHDARLAEVERIIGAAGEVSLWELTASMSWSRPWDQVGRMQLSAAYEAEAHVRYLQRQGVVQAVGTGRRRYRLAPVAAGPRPTGGR